MESLVDGQHHPGQPEEVSGAVYQLRTAPEEEHEGVLVAKECFAVHSVLRDRHAVQDSSRTTCIRPMGQSAACARLDEQHVQEALHVPTVHLHR